MIERIAMLVLLAAVSGAVSAVGPEAPARMYKCVDAKGKTYYTQVAPNECLGRTSEVLSRQGRVVKQIEPLTPDQATVRVAAKKTDQNGIKSQLR